MVAGQPPAARDFVPGPNWGRRPQTPYSVVGLRWSVVGASIVERLTTDDRRLLRGLGPPAPVECGGVVRSTLLREASARRRQAWKNQTACKPGSVPDRSGGSHSSGTRVAARLGATNPGGGAGMPLAATARSGPAGCPYSVLLPVGFTLPPLLPGARCALAAPFHPYPRHARRAVCFLWHFPWGRPRRPLTGTVFPWSPDFPPPGFSSPAAAARPSGVFTCADRGRGVKVLAQPRRTGL